MLEAVLSGRCTDLPTTSTIFFLTSVHLSDLSLRFVFDLPPVQPAASCSHQRRNSPRRPEAVQFAQRFVTLYRPIVSQLSEEKRSLNSLDLLPQDFTDIAMFFFLKKSPNSKTFCMSVCVCVMLKKLLLLNHTMEQTVFFLTFCTRVMEIFLSRIHQGHHLFCSGLLQSGATHHMVYCVFKLSHTHNFV